MTTLGSNFPELEASARQQMIALHQSCSARKARLSHTSDSVDERHTERESVERQVFRRRDQIRQGFRLAELVGVAGGPNLMTLAVKDSEKIVVFQNRQIIR